MLSVQLYLDKLQCLPLTKYVHFWWTKWVDADNEANAFNAHLLIDEDEMDELFRDGYDLAETAKLLKVNINLLLIKIQEMNKLGMNLKVPFTPDARFFRHITE